jgi:phosphate-selective porin OprO/OprP
VGARRSRARWALGLVALSLGLPTPALGQQPGGAAQDTSFATGLTAGEADGERRRRQLIEISELDLGFTTLRVGGGLLFDVAAYDPEEPIEQRFALDPELMLRDARFIFGGRFSSRRPFTWQLGLMWDQVTRKFLFRQTGVMVAVPEIRNHIFIGRAKEGFSLNKVMVGYDGWSMERQPFTDATIPLLADGIKFLGTTPSRHWFWNLGFFTDWLSEGQTFSSYDHQVVLRTGWVPLVSDSVGTLLHIGVNLRTGEANDDSLQLRSKPEAFPAPYFIDTGKFPAEWTRQVGVELYYRPGPVLLGTEYSWLFVDSPETGDPSFHGGEVVVAWLVTGETRSYNTVGSYFRAVSPERTVIQGGPGAWEMVLKFSYADLDGGSLEGGKFWRVTPMLNWHLTDNVRLEFAYGYGLLNRFGERGVTHFSQGRIQMQL